MFYSTGPAGHKKFVDGETSFRFNPFKKKKKKKKKLGRKVPSEPKMCRLHVSNEVRRIFPAKIFPPKFSRQNFPTKIFPPKYSRQNIPAKILPPKIFPPKYSLQKYSRQNIPAKIFPPKIFPPKFSWPYEYPSRTVRTKNSTKLFIFYQILYILKNSTMNTPAFNQILSYLQFIIPNIYIFEKYNFHGTP